jgi:cell division protein FtsW
MIFGAMMVLSASGTYSAIKFNSIYFLFKSHLWKVIVAIGVLIITSIVPYDNYKQFSKYMLLGVLLLLIITLFAPEIKGASRWIDFGIFKFQPSELAKIVLIIHLAFMIERKGEDIQNLKNGFAYPMIWVFLIAGLILVQPNVSTSMIIVAISLMLLYVGGANLKHILGVVGSAGAFAVIGIMMFSHSRSRVFSFIESLINGTDVNLQVKQAKIALGSGGFLGVGLGHSRQSDLFLPEPFGDFIFSILGEETGFIGTLLVLLTYLAIFTIGLIIALKANDKFGRLLAFGISFNIAIAAFINAAVVTGIFPTTGITLPFISFGGTSIIIFAVSVGILTNIGLQIIRNKELKLAQV